MATHAQITQNNIFSISLQCLKKEVNEEADFLHADKDKSYIQIDTMVSDGMVKHSQSSQNSKSAMSLQYLEKEVRDEVGFLHGNKHQNFLQVDFKTLSIKVLYKGILSLLMGMIKYAQSIQSNKLAIALQYTKN